MTIYALYIYNRSGTCLLYRRWHQQPKGKRGVEHETKLMWGLLFSMKELVLTMTPRQVEETEPSPLTSFTTQDSRVHYIETLTGLRLILTTDTSQPTHTPTLPSPSTPPTTRSVADALHAVYRLWVDYCVRNPMYRSSEEGLGAATAVNPLLLVECARTGGGEKGGGEVVERSLDVDCPALVEKIVQLIESLPYFH